MTPAEAPDVQREILEWGQMGDATRELAQSIFDDGYRPDVVFAIARGGLIVAASLAYALGVKNTYTMNVEFYTGVDERLDAPMILPPVPDLVDLGEARLLIADDVADTGRTLALVQEFCAGKVAEVRCAVLYEKSPAAADAVDEAMQALYYQRALEIAAGQPNVVGFLFFHTVDEQDLRRWQSGLFYPDFTPKTSMAAVRSEILALRGV